MDEFISFEIPTDLGPKFNMNSLLKIYLIAVIRVLLVRGRT